MSKLQKTIYVEGQGEIVLLCQLILSKFAKRFDISKDKLTASFKNEHLAYEIRVFDIESGNGGIDHEKISGLMKTIQEFEEIGVDNYLIIDADTPSHKPAGGFKARYEYLEKLKSDNNLHFELFIIPDHCNDGNLEEIMDGIISEFGQPFYRCLSNYIECLKRLNKQNYPVEIQDKNLDKLKFEWYVFMMLGQGHRNKTNATNRDYNEKIWDLKSTSVEPLVNFLEKIFADDK